MSTPRYRGADRTVPKGHCRWCREPIDKKLHPRARTWHPECVKEWEDQRPEVLRRRVKERDRGVCAACGCRANDLRSRVRGMQYSALMAEGHRPGGRVLRNYRRLASRLPRHLTAILHGYSASWAMDHRIPLWAGGTNTLDNCQTLCVPCHRAKTAREAGERAQARRAQLSLGVTA